LGNKFNVFSGLVQIRRPAEFQEQLAAFLIGPLGGRGMSTVRPSEDRQRRVPGRPLQPNWKALPYGAIQMKIGQELKECCDLPRELPHRLLALLIQLDNQKQ
jgi:hypothetical protein